MGPCSQGGIPPKDLEEEEGPGQKRPSAHASRGPSQSCLCIWDLVLQRLLEKPCLQLPNPDDRPSQVIGVLQTSPPTALGLLCETLGSACPQPWGSLPQACVRCLGLHAGLLSFLVYILVFLKQVLKRAHMADTV